MFGRGTAAGSQQPAEGGNLEEGGWCSQSRGPWGAGWAWVDASGCLELLAEEKEEVQGSSVLRVAQERVEAGVQEGEQRRLGWQWKGHLQRMRRQLEGKDDRVGLGETPSPGDPGRLSAAVAGKLEIVTSVVGRAVVLA